ncbi:MAG TPA: nuclear transport factor 2 family protein [Ktedonobacteraceae bacterium]|nr:nuclear transport factor 2 family protein [Ktedonobacteraceae bacterium]
MPTPNVSTLPADSPVNAWIIAFNAQDVPAIVALYAEDAELFDSGMHRSRRGRMEIEAWFRLRFRSMPGNVYAPGEPLQVDEQGAVVPWTLYGRGPRLLGQGWLSRPFQVDGTSTFTLHAGKIYRQYGRYDHLAVLKQILPVLRYCPAVVARWIYSVYLRRHGLW